VQTFIQPLSELGSEAGAHYRRVETLTGKLAGRLQSSTAQVFELCNDFDEAVEFAVFESSSVAEVIASFLKEVGSASSSLKRAEWAELADLAGNGSAAIDIAGISLPALPEEFWTHSELVARVAQELAQLAGVDAEVAYTAGLLHDVGRLGFLKLSVKQRIREQEWLSAGFPSVYAETLAYGVDHAELGARYLRAWGLPGCIAEAVSMHHRPECSRSVLGAVLSLAEDVTAEAATRPAEDLWPDLRRAAACQTTGITLEQLDKVKAFAIDETERISPWAGSRLRLIA
jgi:putative nucleotidyltransferase with HDIG domain